MGMIIVTVFGESWAVSSATSSVDKVPKDLTLHPLPPSHININQQIKSLSIQATMPVTRNRGSGRHGSTASHPYANPADQFAALAFGTDDVSNTHRGSNNTPESQDGSTSPTSPTSNNDPNDDESDPIRRRLAEYRAKFNPESIRKSSKVSSTFDKHQSNHKRLPVWLLDNKPEYLHDEFLQQLNDADAHVDYQVPTHSHTTYRRRGGNKSLEVRIMKCLRVEAKKALGTPGMPPPHPIVRFELLEGDVDCFLNFISSIRKENGGLLKSGDTLHLDLHLLTCFTDTNMFLHKRDEIGNGGDEVIYKSSCEGWRGKSLGWRQATHLGAL
jgi:hypothetical protein